MISAGEKGSVFGCQDWSRLLLEKNCTRVPVSSLNPTISSLNYNWFIHLTQHCVSEKLGHLPAGILSLIGFQWNALKCGLKAFPISVITWCEWNAHTDHFHLCWWCTYSFITVFIHRWILPDETWDGKGCSLISCVKCTVLFCYCSQQYFIM